MKIAHVSTFPPMKCGIAFYASDLLDALPTFSQRKYVLHYGKNLTYDTVSHADASYRHNLRRLARAISDSDCEVVSLQHEFGIWGGKNGEHIVDFLEEITKPVVSTFHTTFSLFHLHLWIRAYQCESKPGGFAQLVFFGLRRAWSKH